MAKRRYRYTWDQIASLDSDFMNSWRAFEPSCRHTVDFNDDRLPMLAFTMDSEGGSFQTTYQWGAIGRKPSGAYIHARVELERRPCRFGGSRVYFICPTCCKTTLRLAVLQAGLKCGACGLVTWESRRKRAAERLMLRASKIAAQLDCDDWRALPAKRPLYMRVARFEALKQQHAAAINALDQHLRRKIARSACLGRLIKA